MKGAVPAFPPGGFGEQVSLSLRTASLLQVPHVLELEQVSHRGIEHAAWGVGGRVCGRVLGDRG